MNTTEFTALMVLATAMSFSPGPNTTLCAALGANQGFRRTLPFIASVVTGWGLLLCLCAVGVGALVVALPGVGLAMKLLGAAYLLWLAARLARSRTMGSADGALEDVGFMQGVALQFVNIKAWMLALAIVSGWIAGSANPGARFAMVLPVMMLFGLASNVLYALVGALLREWLSGPDGSHARLAWFNRLMAAVLAFTAAWMLWR
ncbi:MAG: LysE family translocator [Pseudomonadota bacterium]